MRNMCLEADLGSDVLWVTIEKYSLFLSHGKTGMEAFLLYAHLMFTCLRQGTNIVKANDVYLRRGLHLGKKRLLAAKNLLKELGLVEKVIRRDKKGQITGQYLKIRFSVHSHPKRPVGSNANNQQKNAKTPVYDPLSPQASNAAGGCETTNALTNKSKCLNEKENAYGSDSNSSGCGDSEHPGPSEEEIFSALKEVPA